MRAELVEYYRDFPIDEHVGRTERVRAVLGRQGLDAALLTYEPNIRWLVGYHTLFAPKWVPMAVLITCGAESRSIFMCATDATGSDMAVVDEVRCWDDSSQPPHNSSANPAEVLIAVLKEHGLESKRLGMELGTGMRLDLCQNDIAAVHGGLPQMEVEDISGALWHLRSIKSPREIEKLRRAAEITLEGYGSGFEVMREGMTEKELATVISSKWLELGASTTGLLFLAAGWRSVRYAHVDAVDVPVQRGEIVNLDGGCTVDGYAADIFRMACLGQPANKEEARVIQCIIEAKNEVIAAMKPGVTCDEIWTIAAGTLKKGGYGHLLADDSIGHSVGLELHEWPTLSRGSQTVIEQDMVFCVEPWTLDYADWSMGRNHEDMVRVTAEGTELLSLGFEELVIL